MFGILSEAKTEYFFSTYSISKEVKLFQLAIDFLASLRLQLSHFSFHKSSSGMKLNMFSRNTDLFF